MSEITVPVESTGPVAPEKEGTTQADRPSWLPEKFKSPEDFAKSYAELERRLSRGESKPADVPAAEPEAPAEEPAKADAEAPSDAPAEGTFVVAGVDVSEFSKKFETNGDLEEADYAALEEKGLPRQLVEAYVAGVKAQRANAAEMAERDVQEVFSSVGGSDQYKSLVQWAAKNLSPAELEAYDAVMNSGNKSQILLTVRGLQARYVEVEGKEARLITGDGRPPAADGFRSHQEVIAAMRDPRYKKDSAYRKDVEARLARSDVFVRKQG